MAGAAAVILLLLLLPAPLLPPHGSAEELHSLFGIGWKAAYLFAAVSLHVILYGSIGVVAAFSVRPASTLRGRLLQWLLVPLVVLGSTILIRSLKLGYVPVLTNAVVPLGACLFGVGVGLLLRQHGRRVALAASAVALGALIWAVLPGVPSHLSRDTAAQLRRLVASEPSLPTDETRFSALLKITFAPLPDADSHPDAIEQNRAAILALGIAIGHERLARFVGLNPSDPLVREATKLRQGATLRGRGDWPRHFCLSAALVVLENPFISDAGGLLKEQLDVLARGSGFSFTDLAADRAGVKFSAAATDSEHAAQAMRLRLQGAFAVNDFFPPVADLPENLTVEQFRHDYGGVGDPRYRQKMREIEVRLSRCAGLAPQPE
jgi:hypothetical protein